MAIAGRSEPGRSRELNYRQLNPVTSSPAFTEFKFYFTLVGIYAPVLKQDAGDIDLQRMTIVSVCF